MNLVGIYFGIRSVGKPHITHTSAYVVVLQDCHVMIHTAFKCNGLKTYDQMCSKRHKYKTLQRKWQ